MKRFLKIATLALLVALPATMVLAETGGLRYSITVSKFENRAGWHGQWDIGDAWGTVLTDLLSQTGKFIVLGETDMRVAAMGEQDLVASGRTAQGAKAPVTGQLTPAQLLVKGAITHVQHSTTGGSGGIRVRGFRLGGKKDSAEINATIYVVDSTTGQVLASQSVVGKSDRKGASFGYSGAGWGGDVGGFKNDNVGKAVEAACSEAVDFILAQLPNISWRGSVVMVKNGQVYINRGTREGVSVGQTFVIGETEVIRDPDTGEVLDEDMIEIARVTTSRVKEKLSICDVTAGNAGGVTKGMGVHLP